MATAVLHDEFTPYGGRGGVCASGEIIIGPGTTTNYTYNRIVVFDPVSKTADTYGVTMPGTVEAASHGCAFDGGVAMIAGSSGSIFGVLIFYPDGTYDAISAPLSGAPSQWSLVSDGSTLLAAPLVFPASAPYVFTPGVGWSAGSTAIRSFGQPQVHGGAAIGFHMNDMVSMSMSTGDATTLHAGVGGPSGYAQTAILGGRLWFSASSTQLRGVRISDGHVVNITVPSHTTGPLATDGTYMFIVAPGSAVYQVNPLAFSVVTHTLSSSLGIVHSMHASGGKVWAPGTIPSS